jgi:DNA modification methylase
MGEHLLLCGDATRPDDLSRILDSQPADLVFADLPYNVNYVGKTAKQMTIQNDNLGGDFGDFLLLACQRMIAASRGPLYICMSSSELHRLYTAFTEAGGYWSTFIIWGKNSFTLGRSDYQRQYKPILYGWPEGKRHYWCGDRNQSDLWFIDKPHANDLHPTMKPVELVERAVQNSSHKGDLILDPFAGSGSTAIACENLSRKARLIEIDTGYADVIVRRWQNYTGQSATREQDGRSFDQVAVERRSKVQAVPSEVVA